jgi:hypothetical protein
MISKFFNFLVLLSLPILVFADGEFRLDGQAEPNTYINGCVNAITGSFIHSFQDIVVDGPEPISFVRHYCSNNKNERDIGKGFSHNHATRFSNLNYECPLASLQIEESGGDRIYFRSLSKSGKNPIFYVDPQQLRKGYTNCSGGEISGRNNIKNTVLFASGTQYKIDCRAELGDGTKRYYKLNGLLEYEVKPSGNKIHYNYDSFYRITKIYATDSTSNFSKTHGAAGLKPSLRSCFKPAAP